MVDINVKGIQWIEWYKSVKNDTAYPYPVCMSIDITDTCNLRCYWCNSKRANNVLTLDYIKKLIDIAVKMNVKSVCLGGGGEPTTNPDFAKIVNYITSKGIEVGIVSNGVLMTKEIVDQIISNPLVRFLSLSLDSATCDTWIKLKGLSEFQYAQLLSNINYIAGKAKNERVDFTAKFLVVPENQNEIYDFVVLAKRLGFKTAFIRPAELDDAKNPIQNRKVYNVAVIEEQLKKAKQLETSTFQVIANFGRQYANEKYSPIIAKRCYATPILIMCLANKDAYICLCHKWEKKFRLCKSLDLLKYWNSPKHRRMVKSINPCTDCKRCSFGIYNQIAETYLEDTLMRNFP